MINLDLDFGPVTTYLKVAEAHSRVATSGRTQSLWTLAMGLSASTMFNQWIDNYAGNNRAELGHVYEWGQIGDPQGHLWRNVLAGAGNTRVLDFIWVASKKVVPVGEKATSLGADYNIESDTRRPVHVFRWKAPMTELGVPVTITPKNGGVLAFPIGSTMGGGQGGRTRGGMAFSRTSVRPRVNSQARGQFGAAWTSFFVSGAAVSIPELEERAYDLYANNNLEQKIIRQIKSVPRVPKRFQVTVRMIPQSQLVSKTTQSSNAFFQGRLSAAEQMRRVYSGGGSDE